MTLHRCSSCGIHKGAGEYYAHRSKKTGLQPYCKSCVQARGKAKSCAATGRPDKRVKYIPLALDADGLAACVLCAQPFKPHGVKPKRWCGPCDYRRSIARDNGEAKRARNRAFYAANKERVREAIYARRHATPSAIANHREKRAKAIAERADGTLTATVLRELFAAAKKCAYCAVSMASSAKSLDHLVPLAQGGGHLIANVVVCCRDCNTAKNALSFPAWIDRLRLRHGNAAATRATRLYQRQVGQPAAQMPLTLTFTPAVASEHIFFNG